MDATADIVQLGAILPVLVRTDTMPIETAVIIAAPKAINIVSSVGSKMRKKSMNATSEGKVSTGTIWAGITAFMLHATIGREIPELVDTALEVSGWAGTLGGTAMSLPATREYARVGLGSHEQEPL